MENEIKNALVFIFVLVVASISILNFASLLFYLMFQEKIKNKTTKKINRNDEN